MRRRLTQVVVAAALVGCTSTYDVTVTGFNLDAGLPGFSCQGADGGPLYRRVATSGGDLTVVIDALDFGADQPPCLSVTLDAYCQSKPEGCPVLSRACYPISSAMLKTDGGANLVQVAFAYLHSIDAGLYDVAEDRNVVLRLTAFAEASCDAGLTTAQAEKVLLGCARSCPSRLDSTATVDVYLDIPPGSLACEAEVDECAELSLLHSAQP
jgi:hypothetical protein